MNSRPFNARIVGRFSRLLGKREGVKVRDVLGSFATHQETRHGVLQEWQPLFSLLYF